MKLPFFLFTASILFSCGTSTESVLTKLQGTWILMEAKEKGENRDISQNRVEMTFSGAGTIEIITEEKGKSRVVSGFFLLNTKTTPWSLDIQTSEGAQVYGLIEFTKDGLLHIEHSQSLRPRPADFWNQNFSILLLKKK